MKKLIIVLILMVVGKCGALVLNDGRHHVIDYNLSDGITLQENFWHEQTTVLITPTGTVAWCTLLDGSVATIEGSVAGGVSMNDDSVLILQGGSIRLNVSAHQNSDLYITGGTITAYIGIRDNAQAIISGGSVANYSVQDNGVVTVYGRDFVIDGHQVGYGEFRQGNGRLTGILDSGESFDVTFGIYGNANMVLVADPVPDGVCGDGLHPYPPGDLTRDCRVNLDDLAIIASNWLACTFGCEL